jgi:large subunit ribosomal protein L3
MIGVIGTKVGMTQILNPVGEFWPVSVIKTGPARVTKICTIEKEGYSAIQIGFGDVKEKHLNQAQSAAFKKVNVAPARVLREFRVTPEEAKAFTVGQEITAEVFAEGDFVDVHGQSIGKGFAGMIKRHHMNQGPKSHGSMHHRRIGSIGASSFPSRTWPGHRMPGHMGDRKRTVQNLLVVGVNKEENLLLVRGSVPGFDTGVLTVTKALKRQKIDIVQYLNRTKPGSAASKKEAAAKKPAKKK